MSWIKPIIFLVIGALMGVGATLLAQSRLPDARSNVSAPLEPISGWYDANPRQAALWDGSCPIEFSSSGRRRFKGEEHPHDQPRNEFGDAVGLYSLVSAAAEMGNREAIKCLLAFHWFDYPTRTPDYFYELLWLAHYYGVTAPFEWWADTDKYLTQDQMWVMRDSAQGKFSQASGYFAMSRSKNAVPPAPETDTIAPDAAIADSQAFFDDLATEIFRLEGIRPIPDE